MSDDGIEIRIRSWWRMPMPKQTHRIVTCAGLPHRWMMLADGSMARVDGGDPGDEHEEPLP